MISHDTHHLFDWMASNGLNSQKGIPSRNIPRSVWGKQWAKTAVLSLQSTWSYKLCGDFKRNWVDKPLSQCCNDKGTRFCTGWTQNRSSHLSSIAGAWPPQRSWTRRATGRSPRTRTWRTRTGTAAHIAAAGTSSFGRKTLSRSCQVWQYELAQAWRHPLSWKRLMAGKNSTAILNITECIHERYRTSWQRCLHSRCMSLGSCWGTLFSPWWDSRRSGRWQGFGTYITMLIGCPHSYS